MLPPLSSRSACAAARAASTDGTGGSLAAASVRRLVPGTAATTDFEYFRREMKREATVTAAVLMPAFEAGALVAEQQ